MTDAPPDFRLAELMAMLSRASDLANGATFEQSLAASVVAARLADAMGPGEPEGRDAYYLTMLRTVGCTADGDLGRIFLGEDVGKWITHLPNGSPLGMMAALASQVGRDKKPLDISGKTAGHHVEHIFEKIGATTRAAAGLFAMQNDLLV